VKPEGYPPKFGLLLSAATRATCTAGTTGGTCSGPTGTAGTTPAATSEGRVLLGAVSDEWDSWPRL
jgi:hypothetical protein